MRLGIFSDIHGNLEALDRAISFMKDKGVTQYICLGDIVGYGANPTECVERVRELGCLAVAGNHDYAVANKTPVEYFNDTAQEAVMWTRAFISPNALHYLGLLPLELRFRTMRLVHAAPSAPPKWRYVATIADIALEIKELARSEIVCFIGHTHQPFASAKRADRRLPQLIRDTSLVVTDGGKYLINVGSIGQPRDGDPRLSLVIYETRPNRIEFYRLEYDIKSAQRKIIKAGLPTTLAMRLARGL
jgi:predicted phosphodiesterase